MHDDKTVAYFDKHTPRWSLKRYRHAFDFIEQHAASDSSLIDIGCGGGNILNHVQQKVALSRVVGLDPSPNYVKQTRQTAGCEAYVASILDGDVLRPLQSQFDFAIMGDVLHHLVGNTRGRSRRNAALAVANALALLRPGGYLIIAEPNFRPRLMVAAIFYVKVLFSRLTGDRIEISKKWANIGPPVVSFYTVSQLREMGEAAGAQVVALETSGGRALGVGVQHRRVTLILQRV